MDMDGCTETTKRKRKCPSQCEKRVDYAKQSKYNQVKSRVIGACAAINPVS
uniref:Uncharacterized protein n=1 Tax=Arundo donax TaxID=35708 RepID=A0A0A9CHC0_ARUDO